MKGRPLFVLMSGDKSDSLSSLAPLSIDMI